MFSFQIVNITITLVASITNCWFKKYVSLCASNYATLDAIVNGANGTFQDYVENNSKPLIWIHFHNTQIRINTRIKNSHIYKQFSTIDKKWTPIEHKIVEIQINSNLSNIITRIQSPIQSIVEHIIHQTQGLTFDQLV